MTSRDAPRTLREYLARAMTRPVLLHSPYSRDDRRIISSMEWYKRRLAFEPVPQAVTTGPDVTVVIPTYNRGSHLRRAVLSVLVQSMERFEVVIVDDGSTDDTQSGVRALMADPRVRSVRLDQNRGQATARNVGIEQARAPWVAFLDSDDWWDPDFLHVLLHQAHATGHDFLYSAQRVLRPAPAGLRRPAIRPELIRFAPYNAGLLENSNYISMISVLLRRQSVIDVGGFDDSYSRFVDWDLFLRLADSCPPLGVPAILSTYDQAPSSSVSTDEDREVNRRRIYGGLSATEVHPSVARLDRGGGEVQHRLHGLRGRQRPSGAGRERERRCTVVVPSYGVADYLRQCLESLVAHTPVALADVVIVDNGSEIDVLSVIDEFEQRFAHVRSLRNRRNLGFTAAARQGIEASAPGSDVVLLNNDAVVTPRWLEALLHVRDAYEDVGLVVPRQVLLPGDTSIRTHVPGAVDDWECDTNMSAHHGNVVDPYFDSLNAVTELDFAPFFCVLIPRQILETVGPVADGMGRHFQSDWVYCDAVRTYAGARILHTPHSKVYHFNGRAGAALRSTDEDAFKQLVTAPSHGLRTT